MNNPGEKRRTIKNNFFAWDKESPNIKNNLFKKYKEITWSILYDNNDIHYNIQIKIKYENKIFYINTRNYWDKKEATLKCQNYIRIKDLPQKQNIFCKEM